MKKSFQQLAKIHSAASAAGSYLQHRVLGFAELAVQNTIAAFTLPPTLAPRLCTDGPAYFGDHGTGDADGRPFTIKKTTALAAAGAITVKRSGFRGGLAWFSGAQQRRSLGSLHAALPRIATSEGRGDVCNASALTRERI